MAEKRLVKMFRMQGSVKPDPEPNGSSSIMQQYIIGKNHGSKQVFKQNVTEMQPMTKYF